MRSRSVLLDLLRSQLRRHPGRALTLGVTVALAVTLLTSSFVLAASLRTAVDQGLKVSLDGADVVVRTELGTADTELSGAGGAGLVSFDETQLANLDGLDGVQASASYTRATAVARTGETVLGISLESLASDPAFQWQRWAQGRAPTPGQPEIGLTRYTLDQLHIRLGDLVSIGNPVLGAVNFRVSGIVDVRGSLDYSNAAYGIVPEATARMFAGVTGANVALLRTEPGREKAVLTSVNEAGQGGFAQTTQELIDGAGSAEQTRLAGIDAVLFTFSPLALVVAAIVLGTCILVSLGSRRRQLALLRSVGATRAQTFALVLAEVLVLGLLGSVVGVLAGVALARAGLPLTGLIPGLPTVSGAAFTVPTTGLAAAFAAGVLLSVIGGLLPAWAASRIPPAAVLSSTVSASSSRRRAAIVGVTLLAVGLVAVAVGLGSERATLAVIGLSAVVLGTLLSFGFSVALLALQLSRRLRDSRHTVRQLAANGLSREPGRAAAEGVAVLLATALLAGTWVLLASLHASGSQRLDTLPVPDLTVGAPMGSAPLSDEALDRFRGIDGVDTVVPLPQGVGVTVKGKGDSGDVTLSTGVIGQELPQLLRALPATWDIESLADNTIYLPNDYFKPFKPGSRVSLVGPKGTVDKLKVVYVDDFDLPALVTPALLDRVSTGSEVRTAWLRLADGVDRAEVLAEVSGAAVLAGQVPVGGPALLDLKLSRGIAVTTAASTAFLAVALLVAVIGAVLVTIISVAERWHEHAVLRALGLERPQLRRLLLIRTQAVAGAAAVVGVSLGLLVGLTGSVLLTRALGIPAAQSIPLLPILVLSVLVVLVVRAAVLLPLERAAHVSPASALSQGAS